MSITFANERGITQLTSTSLYTNDPSVATPKIVTISASPTKKEALTDAPEPIATKKWLVMFLFIIIIAIAILCCCGEEAPVMPMQKSPWSALFA